MRVGGVAATLLVCGAVTTVGRAQGITTAALEGIVTGPDTALESAEVQVTNVATGERWRASTSRAGRYAFEHLSPGGPYRVDVRAIGYDPAARTDVSLALDTRTRVDVTLVARAHVLEPVVVSARTDPAIGAERM